MKTNEIIIKLRQIANRRSTSDLVRSLCKMAAQRLGELEAELRDERHRHDRLQDFEVAEAQELARVKAERNAAVRDLKTAIVSGRVSCDFCDHGNHGFDCEEVDYDCARCPNPCPCKTCSNDEKWEWRGIIKKEATL